MLPGSTTCESTPSIHHLVLPTPMHRLPCLHHLQSPESCHSSGLRTLTAHLFILSHAASSQSVPRWLLFLYSPLKSGSFSPTLFTFERCCPCLGFTAKSILSLLHLQAFSKSFFADVLQAMKPQGVQRFHAVQLCFAATKPSFSSIYISESFGGFIPFPKL